MENAGYYQYQYRCDTENSIITEWTDNIPTSCINGADHLFVSETVNQIKQARLKVTGACIHTTNNSEYESLYSFLTHGRDYYMICSDIPIYINFCASIDAGSYDVRIIDIITNNILYEKKGFSNNTPSIYTIEMKLLVNTNNNASCINVQFNSNNNNLTVYNVSTYIIQH